MSTKGLYVYLDSKGNPDQVQVSYGSLNEMPMDIATYESRGYTPQWQLLPTQAEYNKKHHP